MMRNYISVNAKYYKETRIRKIVNHNSRTSDVNYLLPDEHKKYENKSIIYDFNNNVVEANNDKRIELFNQALDKKTKIMHDKGYYKKGNNELLEMVVSLSEEQAKHYLDNDIDLMQGYNKFMENMLTHYGLKPLSVDLHCDEGYINENGKVKYNIHAHCVFHNFDFEKQKTILRTLKKSDWELMQDIASVSFLDNNLKFIRGEAKEDNSLKHLERNDFIAKKQNAKILENNMKILEQSKALEQLQNTIQNLQTTINTKNEEVDEITSQIEHQKALRKATSKRVDLLINEKKEIYEEISKEQKVLRQLKKDKKQEITTLKGFKKRIEGDVNKIIDFAKGTFKLDENKLNKAITFTLKKYANVDLKSIEVDKLQEALKDKNETIETLQEKLNKAKIDNYQTREQANDINSNYNELNKAYKSLKKQNLMLEQDKKKMMAKMRDMSKILKSKLNINENDLENVVKELDRSEEKPSQSHSFNR